MTNVLNRAKFYKNPEEETMKSMGKEAEGAGRHLRRGGREERV